MLDFHTAVKKYAQCDEHLIVRIEVMNRAGISIHSYNEF